MWRLVLLGERQGVQVNEEIIKVKVHYLFPDLWCRNWRCKVEGKVTKQERIKTAWLAAKEEVAFNGT